MPAVDATVARLRFAGLSGRILDETVNTLTISLLATGLTIGCGVVVAGARSSWRRLSASLACAASTASRAPR